MEKKLHLSLFSLIILSLFLFASYAQSQTAGTLTFSVTPTSHSGSYGSSHNVAIWIENSAGTFVKTKARYANTSHCINNHLAVWKANSAGNVVDATTSATLSSYSTPLSVTWNATNVSSAVVADGVYKVYVQCTWDEGTGFDTTSVSFVKGTTAVNLTPTATTNFSGMTLVWTPNFASVPELTKDADIKVYPNPTKGLININFDNTYYGNLLKVENILGQTVYQEEVEQFNSGVKTIDLGNNPNGIYFVSIQSNETKLMYKVLLNH